MLGNLGHMRRNEQLTLFANVQHDDTVERAQRWNPREADDLVSCRDVAFGQAHDHCQLDLCHACQRNRGQLQDRGHLSTRFGDTARLRHEDDICSSQHATRNRIVLKDVSIDKQRTCLNCIGNRAGRFHNYSRQRMHQRLMIYNRQEPWLGGYMYWRLQCILVEYGCQKDYKKF
jgi:hypothetical protein